MIINKIIIDWNVNTSQIVVYKFILIINLYTIPDYFTQSLLLNLETKHVLGIIICKRQPLTSLLIQQSNARQSLLHLVLVCPILLLESFFWMRPWCAINNSLHVFVLILIL